MRRAKSDEAPVIAAVSDKSTPEFRIDKGIPIPPTATKWGMMEVGDSHFIPSRKACGPRAKGAKFAQRFVTENGIKGTRIWRVA